MTQINNNADRPSPEAKSIEIGLPSPVARWEAEQRQKRADETDADEISADDDLTDLLVARAGSRVATDVLSAGRELQEELAEYLNDIEQKYQISRCPCHICTNESCAETMNETPCDREFGGCDDCKKLICEDEEDEE